jgi:endonuclease/exonuclease/phosphatase family metal-dependent hydrolase
VVGLRVATFNIKHGVRADARVDNVALASACADLDADLIGLQEVDRRRRRSGFRNQAAYVARRLRYEHVYGSVLRRGVIGQYGNALLVRGAIHDVATITLPRLSDRQPRGAILARVTLRDGPLTVAVTHLQHHPAHLRGQRAEAPVQLRALLDALAARPGPRLLLGDLNLQPRRARPILEDAGFYVGDRLTFPATETRIKLDYIAFDRPHIAEHDAITTRISDHRALIATIDLS